ncbi:PREDICTED: uncharacterized protein LOC107330094 isoform X2 [Acropora digitifera]|uniref:uncharacterized protein LOC107330094 isoform X2 n=1 Tax=Acropora digitifera TaxID=70779 RepID=UPI00077AF35B|nr:PREDICTED: uncharacterized protein LOC107330094 isoform X2 [Acropora digitifera]
MRLRLCVVPIVKDTVGLNSASPLLKRCLNLLMELPLSLRSQYRQWKQGSRRQIRTSQAILHVFHPIGKKKVKNVSPGNLQAILHVFHQRGKKKLKNVSPGNLQARMKLYHSSLGLFQKMMIVILIAHELGPLWKKVGLVLKVPRAVISQIEANKSEVSDKCYTVLTSWQERFPYDATYHRLALALKHPTVGRVDLAAKFCGPQFGKDVSVAKDY